MEEEVKDTQELQKQPDGVAVEKTTVAVVPPKGRSKWAARFKEQDPEDGEADYDDDETFFNRLDKYDDERSERLKTYEEDNQKLFDAFDKDERIGAVLAGALENGDILKPLLDVYGADLKQILDDPKYLDALREKEAEDKALAELVEANREKYNGVAQDFMTAKGMDDDAKAKFNEFVQDIAMKVAKNDYEGDLIDRLYKAYIYDKATEEAEKAGEAKGRNAQIDIKLKDMDKGDGVPTPEVESPEELVAPQPRYHKRKVWDE